jgi:hypothetical protein
MASEAELLALAETVERMALAAVHRYVNAWGSGAPFREEARDAFAISAALRARAATMGDKVGA